MKLPGFLNRETMLVGLMLLLIAVNSALFPAIFPTVGNLSAILRSLAFDGIMVCGMMLLLVSGTFDLSVGGTFSMAGVVAGWMMKNGELPVAASIAIALIVAMTAGLINGLIVARVRVNALIATLGTMGIYRGVAVLLGGPGITFLPDSFSRPGQIVILGLQGPVWMMAFIALLFSFLLSRTRYFRQYYYIGNNATAARLSGIDVPGLPRDSSSWAASRGSAASRSRRASAPASPSPATERSCASSRPPSSAAPASPAARGPSGAR